MIKRKKATLILLVSVALLTTIFHYLGWLSPIEVFLRKSTRGVVGILYRISGDTNQDLPDGYDDLVKKYRSLEKDAIDGSVDSVEFELLKRENGILRDSLHFFKTNPYFFVSADVVGKSIDPVGSNIVINIGEDYNVPVGAPVVHSGGVLIGRVTEIHDHTAFVRLLDDNQSKFAASILNEENSSGVVEGGYGLSVRMNFIPQNEIINIGDSVISSGLEDGVPRGLIIGYIEAFEKEPYEPFQSAILTPVQDLSKVFLVSVIVPSDQ
ncbi:MAG: rod shape-determining protein MreC [Candidatus Magasanikbacteria bacterium]